MWDLIVSVPDHCLSFYFTYHFWSFVTSFENISSNSDFMHIFSCFYTCTRVVHEMRGQIQLVKNLATCFNIMYRVFTSILWK